MDEVAEDDGDVDEEEPVEAKPVNPKQSRCERGRGLLIVKRRSRLVVEIWQRLVGACEEAIISDLCTGYVSSGQIQHVHVYFRLSNIPAMANNAVS